MVFVICLCDNSDALFLVNLGVFALAAEIAQTVELEARSGPATVQRC